MRRKLLCLLTLACLFILLGAGQSRGQEKLFVANVRASKELTADVPSKLSPALIATKDSGGVLKGGDDRGRPVIAVTPANIANLKASKAVISVTEEVPESWRPVTRLKLSYGTGAKPTEADLKKLGLKLIEDYAKGSFMIVEPLNGMIDSKLARLVDDDPKIQYITPQFQIQAIPRPDERKIKEVPKRTPSLTAKVGVPPTDRLFPQLWGMQNIRASNAWKTINESPDVVVAVIDTGVDYKHPDLAANMWKGPKGKHGFDFVDNDDDPMDGDGHGTHCAGTVGAAMDADGVVGVTWKVRIMACRWLDNSGRGTVADAIKCIDFATDNGADVLSNSWFWTEDDPDLEAAIKRASDKNVLFVAAAANFRARLNNNEGDNDNLGTLGRIPSSYNLPNILAVAAIDENDQLAIFSNWGKKKVHLGAPGVAIVSSVLQGTGNSEIDSSRNYDAFNGTSMATPHVSGAAALTVTHLRKTNAKAPATDAKKLLIANVRPIDSLKDRCTTGGTLNIEFLGTLDPAKKP